MHDLEAESKAGSADAEQQPAPPAPSAPRPASVGRHRPQHRRSAFTWYRVVGGIGRTLIGLGVLILLFVVYQLWGTGFQEARAQDRLGNQFRDRIAQASPPVAPTTVPSVPSTAPPSTAPPSTAAPSTAARSTAAANPTTTLAPIAPPGQPLIIKEGDPIARIEIPKIGISRIVVAGVDTNDLKKGPGHYPDTPLPGQNGNVAIAGHRTTYGAPFNRVDELDVGDAIVLTDLYGQRFHYRVTEQKIISPSDFSVLDPTDEPTLTLTSCHPKFSAAKRIVIKAVIDPQASPPPQAATPNAYADKNAAEPSSTVTTIVGDDDQQPTAENAQPEASEPGDALNRGWFSDSAAWNPTVLYGIVCSMIGLAAWYFARPRRRLWWLIYVAATPVFLFFLYFFYENFSRLLPPAI